MQRDAGQASLVYAERDAQGRRFVGRISRRATAAITGKDYVREMATRNNTVVATKVTTSRYATEKNLPIFSSPSLGPRLGLRLGIPGFSRVNASVFSSLLKLLNGIAQWSRTRH